ncbi:MAG: sensor histidine kinase [Chloroflexota bacterium]
MERVPVVTTVSKSWGEPDRPPRRLFRGVGLFWCGVIAILMIYCAAQAIQSDPSLPYTLNGLLTAILMVAFSGWFVVTIRSWRWRRMRQGGRVSQGLVYLMLGVGLALTTALVLLHGAFIALIYVVVGVACQALEWQASLVPVAASTLLYLYASGFFRGRPIDQDFSDLFTLVVMIGLDYSIAALVKSRIKGELLIAELREAHQQLRLSAAREVELAALRERNRLAREMHDSLGHALVLIAIKLEAAQRLQAVDPARANAECEDTKALVRSTMSDLRSSLAGLRPRALDEQPFGAALTDLASGLGRRAGLEVAVTVSEPADALDRDVQEAMYRVAQEGLANVARHARARHAAVSVDWHDGFARLEVEDDGVGLGAAARSEGGHYGVLGMRERVEAMGGTLTLGPRAGGGTRLRASIPVKEGDGARDSDPPG